ncbi:hypothetical protein [Cupriavidus taiwanensis]|uniref:Uncharacterized protein n=1 Tax=Cupriavidus taiwanensis (strain DSM 17343 / BCRC 17206 / CCUG 44338 / CIP 107171 / LMG 19424 / R1) TaxID=977880 RepID=B3R3I9_CUPTR|nr:hypothetical protein [Cupriavidus taiwanensis]CAQ68870.1 hypothetical protein RALTA_A0903 [Cupriavidus taiwanensis LMG 19424]
MPKYTKRAALAHIRARALDCLDPTRERAVLSGSAVAGHLHEIAEINHKYVRDYGANSLGAVVADLQVCPLMRLLRILARVESMEMSDAR